MLPVGFLFATHKGDRSMSRRLLAGLLCAGITTVLAMENNVFSFGTGIALRPGKFVPIESEGQTDGGRGAPKAPPGNPDDIVAVGGGKGCYTILRYDGSV